MVKLFTNKWFTSLIYSSREDCYSNSEDLHKLLPGRNDGSHSARVDVFFQDRFTSDTNSRSELFGQPEISRNKVNKQDGFFVGFPYDCNLGVG